MLNLSIVIPAYNDIRLEKCLKSIDEDVEIVIVLNGATEEVKKIAYASNAVLAELPQPNLAKAYNYGIEVSTKENVLIMDSDCFFKPGTIIKLYTLLKDNPLAKGRVMFTFNSFAGKIIARSRHIHTSKKNAYSPPLAFKKEILEKVSGYYFDEKLAWTEDYDFDVRVKAAGLKISYDDTARVFHPELGIKQDLRSSFNYGIGHARGVLKNKKGYYEPRNIISAISNSYKYVKKKYGYFTALYLIFWQIAFYIGYKKEVKEKKYESPTI